MTLSTREFCTVAGVTYRQADYWARTGLLRPSGREANGCGSRREYTRGDARAGLVIHELLAAGFRLDAISAEAVELAQSDHGGVVFVARSGGVATVFPVGEPLVWCLDLDQARQVITDRLTEMRTDARSTVLR